MPKPLLTPENAPGCSIIVDVLPGAADKVRQTMKEFFANPLTPQAIDAVGTIQYARWILFDNDTKFLYTVLFDGDFDKYWEDFFPWFQKAKFPPVFTHTKGFPNDALTNLEAWKKFMRDHQVDSIGEYGALGGATRKEIQKALAVNKAFQKVLDNPAAAKALQDPALKPLLDLASE